MQDTKLKTQNAIRLAIPNKGRISGEILKLL